MIQLPNRSANAKTRDILNFTSFRYDRLNLKMIYLFCLYRNLGLFLTLAHDLQDLSVPGI